MATLAAEFWKPPIGDLFAQLAASPAGLTKAQAASRRKRFGRNDVFDRRKTPLWLQFLSRFRNPLILILLFASVVSAATGDIRSFALIVIIVVISVVIDFVQEVRADRAIEALRRSVALRADVLRDGTERALPVTWLVPGDVVKLIAGDVVPADCRLIASRDLFVDQALLTGEPYPVEKHEIDAGSPESDPAAAANCVFMGSSVVSGTATALVCRTGKNASLGKIAGTLAIRRSADAFARGIQQFGFLMLRLTVLLVLFVLAINLMFARPWLESMLFALALAVGLTPELLPMIVTVTLAGGARRLAAKRVIVKRLPAIHDLGAMDVLCTDKTGTLTEAKIRLVRHVDGDGVDSDRVFRLAYLNSAYESGLKSPLDHAILDAGTVALQDWTKLDEVPFDFERRRVSVLVADKAGSRQLIVKGAPEDILHLATAYETDKAGLRPLDDAVRTALHRQFEAFGGEGFRVLAIAVRAVGPEHATATVTDETELTFAGFAAFLDPPRASAAAAVRALAASGVEIKILSGDNERVTQHVCAELGIPVRGVLTGSELVDMSEEALFARLPEVNLFCRVTPAQKRRVLLALRRRRHVVGFLGDGINDASALHAADVGISVDSAADVAKQAADLILLDRSLTVVHDAVIEGRRTVENVTKYIMMGSSSNFGNMFSMVGAALFLPFLPMRPIQILLNNLLYDCSELGIPLDHVDPETLQAPVRWDLGAIQRFMLLLGPVSSLFDFLTFGALIWLFQAGEALFQTGWFVESIATQVLVIFVIRTRQAPWKSRPHPLLALLAVGTVVIGALLPLTPLGALFGFVAPPPAFFVFLIVATLLYLALVEASKRLFYRYGVRPARQTGP